MNKVIQGLVIIVVAGMAAQMILAAVAPLLPLVPYAIGMGIIVLAVGAWHRRRSNRW